eukprot:CAMPEP_0195520748 /NCGR_PEP_ID=MMETSP0794_2-20130614/17524_1 /TAXON_ID=515487 /ORGANISM="Stephanopyxis turris, Strain CCMP 815" /LENGTH=219 /DNA_ID=CAMNT_0040650167 /DNA_START=14 /DNA_END=673 /DNA_ORIENTATION=+
MNKAVKKENKSNTKKQMTNVGALLTLCVFLCLGSSILVTDAAFLSSKAMMPGRMLAMMSTPSSDDAIEQNEENSKPISTSDSNTQNKEDDSKMFDDNMSNRFKYKVNALMGTFDPPSGPDDEKQDGNILNALLVFPTTHSFTVVGRTNGDEAIRDQFVNDVRSLVSGAAGGDADSIQYKVTPRGKTFTRVCVEVTVDSAAIITSVYDSLGDLEQTVMRY